MKKRKNNWWLAGLLTLPVLIYIIAYYTKFHNILIAPGYLNYDNIQYMAYAREYLDADGISLLYSNPFNESGNYPKIYFHIQHIVFLVFFKMGVPPGIILISFTWLCSLITFRLIIEIFDYLQPLSRNRNLSILFFAWGGGLLTLGGMLGSKFVEVPAVNHWDRLFLFDPGWGWWGLNLGRSLLFSMEAYYHALFLGIILCILKRKWIFVTGLSFLLSISHPYSGIELLSILVLWVIIEIAFNKKRLIPPWFPFSIIALFFLHLWYYLIFLNQFPDHQSVQEQCAVNMNLRYYNMIPAYCIVGALAILSLIKTESVRSFFSVPHNRLFTCWFIVTFLLVNHELFMKPMEPVHFTRGYVWSSLFLLGLPGLDWVLNFIKRKRTHLLLITVFSLFFLSDNLTWLLNYSRKETATHQSVYLTNEQNNVLKWLGQNADTNSLVLTSDVSLSLLATVDSKAYSWTSHNLATPFLKQKLQIYEDFIEKGSIDNRWYGRKLIFIMNRSYPSELKRINNLPFTPDSKTEIYPYVLLSVFLNGNNKE